MILLDTTVLTELMQPETDPRVLAWVDEKPRGDLFVAAVTRAEIALGTGVMGEEKRRLGLARAAQDIFELFATRCLPFDEKAAIRYGALVANRLRSGNPISVEDAQIAAIALTHDLQLATANVADFAGIPKLEIIDPWNA